MWVLCLQILTKRSSFTHRIFHIPAQVRWMGDLDTTAWYQAYTRVVDRANHLHGYNPTLTMMENAAIALHRMKTVMREPHWHPFVMKMVDDKPVEQIVEDNEVFVEIRRVWGNEICALVMRAVSELEEYNRSARLGVAVPWNFEEDKIFTYGQTIDQFGNALQEADAILERCSCGRFDHYNNARNSPDWTPPNEESVPTFSFSRPNTPNLSFQLPQAQNPTQEPTGEHHHHHHDHHQEPTDAHHLHVAHNEPRIQIWPRNEIHHEGGDHHHHHHHEPHLHLQTDDLEMALDAYQWPNDDGADHFDPPPPHLPYSWPHYDFGGREQRAPDHHEPTHLHVPDLQLPDPAHPSEWPEADPEDAVMEDLREWHQAVHLGYTSIYRCS